MAKSRVVTETVTCDVCGKPIDTTGTTPITFGSDRWEIDLCRRDLALVGKQIAKWTSNARRVNEGRRRTSKQAADEWGYLESLGFSRHRGRKSAAEAAALAKRR